jgi:nucleoside 2-deoxyribosyltransferase
MNKLCGEVCYLAGPMDRVADGGIVWRQNLTPFLETLGVVVLDPCDKPIDIGVEDTENRELRKELKEQEKFEEITPDMKTIRRTDLRMVDKSDFLIVNVDVDVHMCGTYEEETLANSQKKPILYRIDGGRKNVPDWLIGKVPHQFFFSTWSELRSYLVNVDNGSDTRHFKRWMFFDLAKKRLKALLMAADNDPELRKMICDWSMSKMSIYDGDNDGKTEV